MPTELLMPNDRVLIPGFHGPQVELDFVSNVYKTIRGSGFLGGIALIGSRAKGNWISENSYFEAVKHIKGFTDTDSMFWYKKLNELAKRHNYYGAQIPLLVDEIMDAPQDIIDLVRFENPRADYDLMLKTSSRPTGIELFYYSDELDQNVDIHVEGEGFGFRE